MSKKSNDNLTYDAAMAELNTIVETIQNGQCGIDELATYLQRAKALADFCKERLRTIEKEVEDFKKSMES